MRKIFTHLSLVLVALAPVLRAESVMAAPAHTASVQELHVTAIVPAMRHVILDHNGRIVRITSNTPSDVTPQVYVSNDIPSNEQPLTNKVLEAYRQYVPTGTAQTGILYQRALPFELTDTTVAIR